jgi:hypothetical protein
LTAVSDPSPHLVGACPRNLHVGGAVAVHAGQRHLFPATQPLVFAGQRRLNRDCQPLMLDSGTCAMGVVCHAGLWARPRVRPGFAPNSPRVRVTMRPCALLAANCDELNDAHRVAPHLRDHAVVPDPADALGVSRRVAHRQQSPVALIGVARHVPWGEGRVSSRARRSCTTRALG